MAHEEHESKQDCGSGDGHAFHGMEADARALKIVGWLTGVYFLIELGLGFYSGSVAVISDAFHTFSAVGGVLIALVANRISMRVMWKSLKGNLNMKGAFWHVMQTFVGSIIIIVAAVVIQLTGWNPIDPILGMLFGLVLFWASWGIIKQSFDILLEAAPEDVDVGEVITELQQIESVEDVHHIHAWSLTSGKNLFMAHIKIDEGGDHETVLEKAHKVLKDRFSFYFSTLQVEKICRAPEEAKAIDYAGEEGI